MKAFFVLFMLGLILAAIGVEIYGLVLAFSASIILGIIVLLIEPLPLLLGAIGILGHPEVAKQIAGWLHLV